MELSRSELYEKFQNGLKPDENDFKDLIDSSSNLEDDPNNAGWYYFSFLPLPSADEGSNVFEIKFEGTSTTNRSNSTGIDAGYMNIYVPKGVTRIKNFLVEGEAFVVENQSAAVLMVNLLKYSTEVGVRVSLFDPQHVGIYRALGRNPIKDPIPVEAPVDPDKDMLQVKISALPWGLSDNRSQNNRININLLGIEFE